jgi:hypothetical protein
MNNYITQYFHLDLIDMYDDTKQQWSGSAAVWADDLFGRILAAPPETVRADFRATSASIN